MPHHHIELYDLVAAMKQASTTARPDRSRLRLSRQPPPAFQSFEDGGE
jgi:hypothetical protein